MSLESSARPTPLPGDIPTKVRDHRDEATNRAEFVGANVSLQQWADDVRESRRFHDARQKEQQEKKEPQEIGSGRGQPAQKLPDLPDLRLAMAETEKEKEVQEKTKPKDANDRSDLFNDRSRIDKIIKFEKVDGKDVPKEITLKPGEKLKEGTYEIRYKQTEGEKKNRLDARAFRVHIPEGTKENAPVMVVTPGVSAAFQNPRGYVKEVHMEEVADAAKQKFIVVTPLTQKHKLNDKSFLAPSASAWNYPDSLIPNGLVKNHQNKVGYNDGDYMAGVADLTKDLTGATKDQRRWGWMGGSQGAAFLHSLASNDARFGDGKMRNIYVAGGSIPDGKDSERKLVPKNGNGARVVIVDTAGDTSVLPHIDKKDVNDKNKTNAEESKRLAGFVGLGDVNNVNQRVDGQAERYIQRGGKEIPILRSLDNKSKEFKVVASIPHDDKAKFKTEKDFDVPLANQPAVDRAQKDKKDVKWDYTVKSEADPARVTVYHLPTAVHVIPGPREGSTSSQKGKKYEGVYSAKIFADSLLEENERLSARK